jgi:hypothetical protein
VNERFQVFAYGQCVFVFLLNFPPIKELTD